jgi:hypothetical protein
VICPLRLTPTGFNPLVMAMPLRLPTAVHMHAEVLGELARGQHGLEAEPGEAFAVHDTKVFEANPARSSTVDHPSRSTPISAREQINAG